MSSLYWPGDDRPGVLFSDAGLLEALAVVETAWTATLADHGVAPPTARHDHTGVLTADDAPAVAAAAVRDGNPVTPVLELLRERLGDTDVARWLHRGLTSQDVLDTALVLMARDATAVLTLDLRALAGDLAGLADRHRATPMVGRTLTQPAVPIRFGAKVAGWLHGILDAADDLDRLTFPVQAGGAAGTLSGTTVLTGGDPARAVTLAADLAARLELAAHPPWHTDRAPVTRIGEAFTRVTAACGRIANDVLTLGRPEVGELTEPTGGGSSTMPQKANPVLSVLIRRAALAAPSSLAQLHLAAADTGDERPPGAWHLEWQPLQQLARHTLTAVAHTTTLVAGLGVHPDRMAANLAAAEGVHAEREHLEDLSGALPAGAWAGADDVLVDAALHRVHDRLGGTT